MEPDVLTLILKLTQNNEKWYDEIAWFNWNRQRKFSWKWNVAIVKIEFYVKFQKISIYNWDVMLGDARTVSEYEINY